MPDHILLVDDDPLLLDAVRFSLERAGYLVHTASTGAEALALAGRQALDLAILDIGLPDTDGLRLCRQLQAGPARANRLPAPPPRPARPGGAGGL